MTKTIKILVTSCIAAVGVGASVGGAFALYTKNAQSGEFNIGTYTHTSSGSITYKIGDVVNSLGTNKVNPDNKSFQIIAPLGGVYSNDIPAQDVVYGNLSVKATIGTKLVDNVEWSVWTTGYDSESYWGTWDNGLMDFTGGNQTLVAAETTVNKDIAVEAIANPVVATGEDPQLGQCVNIYVNFKNITETNFIEDYAGAEFRFDITFGELSTSVEVPQIMGDGNGWSLDAKEYRMVPDITNPQWKWEFKNLNGFSKFVIVDEKEAGTYYIKDVNGNDVEVTAADPWQVYYNGSSGEPGDRNVLNIDNENHVVYQA